jgi:SAM-dependent MidA family methyltransferase
VAHTAPSGRDIAQAQQIAWSKVNALSSVEPVLQNEALVEVIRREITREGRMTFARFMDLALYHPRLGYYSSRRETMGRSGDYVTSSEVHPIFGALVGKQLAEMWAAMDRPSVFELVEIGGGTGALARDILRWLAREAPDLRRAARYLLIERSARQRERQEETLADAGLDLADVSWSDDLPASFRGCLFSNEVFDALPVHLVTVEGGRLREVYVTAAGEGFMEVIDAPSTPELPQYCDRLGLSLPEGARAEVNLEAPQLMARIARPLAEGWVLTFDYGYPAAELYAPWRKQGTLLCFHRHAASDNPYIHVGRQDITAHVDFTTLIETGRAHGLEPVGMLRQAEFLSRLGIADLVGRPTGQGLEEYTERRRAMIELTDPVGLGRVQVLLQRKGVAAAGLAAFGPENIT